MVEVPASDKVFRVARELAAVTSGAQKQLVDLARQTEGLDAAMQAISGSARLAEPLLASASAALAEMALTASMPDLTASAAAASLSLSRIANVTFRPAEDLAASAMAAVGGANLELASKLSESVGDAYLKLDLGGSLVASAMAAVGGANLELVSKLSESVGEAYLKLDIGGSLAASMAAQQKLSDLSEAQIGNLVGLSAPMRQSTLAQLNCVTASYNDLVSVAGATVMADVDLSMLTSYPSVDYYRHVEAIEAITLPTARYTSESIHESLDRGAPTVDDLLMRFDASLYPLLVGARASVDGANPDRVRHAATSLRELLTQTLHMLAPDESVRSWTTAKEHYHNGRPTRRARLLYVCRQVNVGEFGNFVDVDVSSALALIDLLNSGAHAVESRLTPEQLTFVVVRFESLLLFLLRIGLTGERGATT